jgi:hypothetical protein
MKLFGGVNFIQKLILGVCHTIKNELNEVKFIFAKWTERSEFHFAYGMTHSQYSFLYNENSARRNN